MLSACRPSLFAYPPPVKVSQSALRRSQGSGDCPIKKLASSSGLGARGNIHFLLLITGSPAITLTCTSLTLSALPSSSITMASASPCQLAEFASHSSLTLC